jgi:hypothetical protein
LHQTISIKWTTSSLSVPSLSSNPRSQYKKKTCIIIFIICCLMPSLAIFQQYTGFNFINILKLTFKWKTNNTLPYRQYVSKILSKNRRNRDKSKYVCPCELVDSGWLVWFMVFNATFNNISAISWRQVALVEETGVFGRYAQSPNNWKPNN